MVFVVDFFLIPFQKASMSRGHPARPCLHISVRLSTCIFQHSILWGQNNYPLYWTHFLGVYWSLYIHYYSVSLLFLLWSKRSPFNSKGKPFPFYFTLHQKHPPPNFFSFPDIVEPQACWVHKFCLPLSSKFAQGNEQVYILALGSIFIYFSKNYTILQNLLKINPFLIDDKVSFTI